MRLDKFLKVSRLIKRRSVAKSFAENERVEINSRLAKPASSVKVGDIITVILPNKRTSYEVLELHDQLRANESEKMYRQIED